jgi:hypothetical protein
MPIPESAAVETGAATPTATPVPPEKGLVLQELEVPPEEMVGPPAPGQPVGRIEGVLTVQDKKKKKKKSDLPQEEIAGKVKTEDDKQWLSEVCPLDEKHGGSWLDRSQERLGWSVCRATLWFDGLFGDERAITERDATYGYVQPKLDMSEHDGVNPGARVRAKYSLPVANRRFNALLGRNDESSDDTRSRSGDVADEQLPESFREADDEWLVGLGYSPVRGNRRRIDFDTGVKLSMSPDFFVQGRYRRHWFMGDDNLVRLRDAVFWRTDDGLGTRLDVDFERVLTGHPLVFRWRNSGTYAQRVEGVDWFEELTLFQRLGLKTALAYVLNADGETDAEVPVRNYGFEVVYRRNILREWLFVELRPGVDWRRREVQDQRKLEPVLTAGLQINFGDRNFE